MRTQANFFYFDIVVDLGRVSKLYSLDRECSDFHLGTWEILAPVAFGSYCQALRTRNEADLSLAIIVTKEED